MLFFYLITSAVAAVIFGIFVTRPSMRILTKIWPNFFDQMDTILILGLKEGLHDYQADFSCTPYYDTRVQNECLTFFMKVSAGCAFLFSCAAMLIGGASIFVAILAIALGLLGSLLPLAFGLLLMGACKLMLKRDASAQSVEKTPAALNQALSSPGSSSGIHLGSDGSTTSPVHQTDSAVDVSPILLAMILDKQQKLDEIDEKIAKLPAWLDRFTDELVWQISCAFYRVADPVCDALDRLKTRRRNKPAA